MAGALSTVDISRKRVIAGSTQEDFVRNFCYWVDAQAAFMTAHQRAESEARFRAIVLEVWNRLCHSPDGTR
jgi:predicted phosphoadenosine phosphosulfate sulfurtransferase